MTNFNVWIWPKLKPTNLNYKDWSVISPSVLLTSMPDFFLVEEGSHGANEAGQVSQSVPACKPGLGDLSKPTAQAFFLTNFTHFFNHKRIKELKFAILSEKVTGPFSSRVASPSWSIVNVRCCKFFCQIISQFWLYLFGHVN